MSDSLEKVVTKRRSLQKLLRKQIDLYQQSYREISRLATEMNEGLHPAEELVPYRSFFLQHLGANDLVLVVNCGRGDLAYTLASQAKEVIGIDQDKKLIAAAQARYRKNNLQFLVGEAISYVYGKRVTKIVLSHVLEYVEDRPSFLKQLRQISSGLFLRVSLLNRDWLTVYEKNHGYKYCSDPRQVVEYTMEDLHHELQQSGWRIEASQCGWGEIWASATSC